LEVLDAREAAAGCRPVEAQPQGDPATVELARAGGGTVHVPPTVRGESLQEAQQLVDGIVEELKMAGVTAEGAVRPSTGGSPAGPILEYAHKLTQLSTCPVLVVRDQASLEERHHDVLRAQTRFQS
jgi:nucleotide-binding universal stress UspA family protein